jgi:hypothetical protein
LTRQGIFIRLRDLVIGFLVIISGWILDLERNIHTGLLASKGITNDVDLPREESSIWRSLELNLVRAVVPVSSRFRVRDFGDLDRRNNNAVGFIVC